MKLTEKQKRFADEYLIDLNASAAYIRAGYSPKNANANAPKLLQNTAIRAYIDERMAEHSRRIGVNQERIIRELARIAFVNAPNVVNFDDATIREDASEDDTAAIASVKVKTIPTQDGEGVEREIRFADKLKALELLGKRFNMWVNTQEQELRIAKLRAEIVAMKGDDGSETEDDGFLDALKGKAAEVWDDESEA